MNVSKSHDFHIYFILFSYVFIFSDCLAYSFYIFFICSEILIVILLCSPANYNTRIWTPGERYLDVEIAIQVHASNFGFRLPKLRVNYKCALFLMLYSNPAEPCVIKFVRKIDFLFSPNIWNLGQSETVEGAI